MKQLKYILIFGIVLFMPNIVKAEECSVTNTSRLKKIASNITTKYDYIENVPTEGYGNVDFTATISNVTSDLYIMRVDEFYNPTGSAYYSDVNKQIIISALSEGVSYHFVVYGNTNDVCKGIVVYEFYVTTPNYNKYYTNTLCDEISNYTYCQKWANINLTEEEFVKNVNKYIKSLETEDSIEEPEVVEDKYKLFLQILEFLTKYNIPIFGSIIALSAIGIIIYRKKDNFDLDVK